MKPRTFANFIGLAVLFFFSSLLFLLATPSSLAVGLSPALVDLDYAPNHEYTLDFFTTGAESIETYVRGDLAPYAEIIDTKQGEGPRNFQVILRIPADINPPGKRTLLVGVIEAPPEGAMVGGRAAYQAPVTIHVPYPGVYLETDFSAPTVNVNEPVNFGITITNRGRDSVEHLTTSVLVLDAVTNETVVLLDGEPVRLDGQSNTHIIIPWDTTGKPAGPYTAELLIGYDGQSLKHTKDFRIGSQFIKILNFTREVTARTINPFEIKIESQWNSPFDGIYGEITINGTTFRTPPGSLEPWKTQTLLAYWDATRIEPGTLDATVKVFYGGTFSQLDGTVTVVDRTVVESPAAIGMSLRVGIAVLLITVALFIILVRRKKK